MPEHVHVRPALNPYSYSCDFLWTESVTEAPGDLWSINNDKSPGGTRGFPFPLRPLVPHTHTHTQLRCTLGKHHREDSAQMWGWCPISEAALEKKSSRGQERMQFILRSSWFRMKEADTERGSGGTASSKALGLIQKWTGHRARKEEGKGKNENRNADWVKGCLYII